ncbi:MAG TPA: hypothetical protein VHC47_09745 [Mucilaginibacter sp.]|nr:hypothetical protein [Mucilaginibacter sp.]
MRKLLKVILPPFVGFAVYFIAVRYSTVYFSLRIDEMGEGTLKSFMSFYRYLLPLLFTVAVLTQLLIVVPVWDKVRHKSLAGRIVGFLVLCFICLIFAAGISYLIWDKQTGIAHFVKVCIFMAGVQIGYWIINMLVLLLLSKKPSDKVRDIKNSE